VLAEALDAHVHFWDPGRLDYPWLRTEPRLRRPFLPADLAGRLDAADTGVTGVLVVQADCRWEQAEAEVAWLEDLAARTPLIRGVVAAVPLERGRDCATLLAGLARRPLVVGVRRLIQDEPAGFCRTPGFVEGTRLLAGHGLVSDLCIRHHQFGDALALVRQCPDVVFVLDHVGKPDVAGGGFQPWADELAALAALPNVYCKLSGLTSEAGPAWHPEALLPYLRHALSCFSPARCLFGSDWPVASLQVGYGDWYLLVREAMTQLGADEQADVLGGTARRVYGLGVRAGTGAGPC
jgi:L-fuconolactonase